MVVTEAILMTVLLQKSIFDIQGLRFASQSREPMKRWA